MLPTRRFGAAIVLASTALLPWLSSSCAPEPPKVTLYDFGPPLVIGVAQSLTGTEAVIGQPLRNAAQVAEWQVNAAGGVLGRKVQFQFEDDRTDQQVSIGLANAFIKSGVAAVIGPTASRQAVAMAAPLYDAKTILMSSTALTTTLTTSQPERDRYFFRTVPPTDVHGRVLADIAAKGISGQVSACKKIAIAAASDETGNSYKENFSRELQKFSGITITKEVSFPSELKSDYKAEISDLTAGAVPDCLMLFAFAKVGSQFMLDYKRQLATTTTWKNVQVLGSNTLYSPSFINDARNDPSDPSSPSSAESVVGILVDPAPGTTQFAEFKKMYFGLFPKETTLARNTANTYDAAMLLLLAIVRAGGFEDRPRLRDALYEVSRDGEVFGPGEIPEAIAAIKNGVNIDYKGASGNVDFDNFGNVRSDFIVWKVKAGEFTVVEHVPAEMIK
ncbi:MAG: ABC transporter substrate-binding protein [Polyangiaceae bacterium]